MLVNSNPLAPSAVWYLTWRLASALPGLFPVGSNLFRPSSLASGEEELYDLLLVPTKEIFLIAAAPKYPQNLKAACFPE
ncbi:hypothetical protein PCASD_19597 [Puccinia coronata f. sp. avenae]|uniref:Uncharacterized protein n=1 Tax=Puccinia coronata f. sp. avenae TaxID=200324 RepID=A0A2N5TSE6_9BASI|nr:hypothetical protein PCASD_19971 [Puccinia coronata f. sp. avenae]PLW28397.1 hypothetical protein PCASD_19597 [Puccinia coronata f. sp. avenae]